LAAMVVPLIKVPDTEIEPPSKETSHQLVRALQTSGFLLVQSPLLTPQFQLEAIEAANTFLDCAGKCNHHLYNHDDNSQQSNNDVENAVISHPTDPKVYAMLSYDDINKYISHQGANRTLKKYMDILRRIKVDILRHIAFGLDIVTVDNDQDGNSNDNNDDDDENRNSHCNFLSNLHSDNNDTLRLISYYPTNSAETGNRCKEHSDYGTLTLLSTDGTSGLELFDFDDNGDDDDGEQKNQQQRCWVPVPHVEGALVVNVGSLLSGWTGGLLKATLHRVAGPASLNSRSSREVLLRAVQHRRTSIAFFVDPNEDLPSSLLDGNVSNRNDEDKRNQAMRGLQDALGGMSISEYIKWRSGGSGADRSGVSFTKDEQDEIEGRHERKD